MQPLRLIAGGGAYLGVPNWLGRLWLLCLRLFGIRGFDTAYAYGFGKGESLVGSVAKDGDFIITKWGLNERWINAEVGAERWLSRDFDVSEIANAISEARVRLGVDKRIFFLLHCPDPERVLEHVSELARLREQDMVSKIGYSVNSRAQVLVDNSWADLIEGPFSVISQLTNFQGILAIHGFFREGVEDSSLLNFAKHSKASMILLIAGSWKPWRLVGNAYQVYRTNKKLLRECKNAFG